LAVALHLDRLIALAPSPLTGRDRARCVHASAWRIIARSYAGWLPPASELHELRASLGGLPSNLKVRTAALVDMCELSAEINGGGPRLRELVEQSEASLRPLGDADPALGARVFGTIGRALTRLGRHDEARERLRTALDLHADGENEVLVESPRSRLYLAQGHFHAGEIEAAHTELEAALREIDEHERASRDRDYLRTTRMFVLLALAKCRVVLGGTDRVVRAGLELDEAFALHPGTGISSATLTLALLRTRAWVAGTSGDETAREAALGAAESVRAAMGSDADARQAARADAILAEARAKPTHEGVVD
jgi:tetratricopeptide (TPR) repeat protein